jgi:hypothetical protein
MIVLFTPGGVLGLVEDLLKRIGKAGAAATKQRDPANQDGTAP